MSQPAAAPAPAAPYPPYLMVPVREGNGLGVAGFFIALVGLFIPTGIVALLGLLVSLVALGKAPRGFAGMGVLLGLVGTVAWLLITGVALLGLLVAGAAVAVGGAAAFVLTQPEVIEVTADMLNVTIAAVEYEDENGELPENLEVLGLSASTLTDPWGNPYRYTITTQDPGFDVTSSGADGTMGTDDDLALSRLDRIWEDAAASFGEKVEEFGERMERLQGRHHHRVRIRHDGHHWRSTVQGGDCGLGAVIAGLQEARAEAPAPAR